MNTLEWVRDTWWENHATKGLRRLLRGGSPGAGSWIQACEVLLGQAAAGLTGMMMVVMRVMC